MAEGFVEWLHCKNNASVSNVELQRPSSKPDPQGEYYHE
jgi:hypothetical protein